MDDEKIYTNIGHVTAYSYAVSKGYIGTEEQFAEELARFAENAQAVREDREHVDSVVEAFVETTVPNAIQSVTSEGATQVANVTTEGTTQVGNVQTAGTTQVGNVTAEGNTQVGRVTSEGNTQVSRITAEGTTQKNSVTAEGTRQVGLVTAEGTTQVGAVEDKGQEVLDSIPDDYSDLVEHVDNVEGVALNLYQTETATAGPIVTFDEGADNTPLNRISFDINPVQDLHGQENPYPAGGGKNLLPKGQDKTFSGITYTVQDNGEVVVTGTATGKSPIFWGVQFTIPVGTYILNGCPSGGSNSTYLVDVRNTVGGVGISGISADTGNGSTFTISEELTAYVNIRIASGYSAPSGGLKLSPMIRLATETDDTFAPYSNICPITGWTGAEIEQRGTNLFDEVLELGRIETDTGQNSVNSNLTRSKNYIPIPQGATLYLLLPWAEVFWYRADKTYIGYGVHRAAEDGAIHGGMITPPNDAYYMRFRCSGTYGTTYKHDISINYPATDTEYHAYTGNTYSISFPSSAGTVYSGHVTVEKDGSGTLVVDKANVDMGNLAWNYNGTRFQSAILPIMIGETRLKGLCDIYPIYNGTVATAPDKSFIFGTTSQDIYVKDSSFTDAESFKSAMAGHQVVYELATPISYTLSPIQIKSLLGLNHIWASTGDITELIYYVGNQFVDEKIEQEVADATDYALKAYATDTASGAIATFPDGADGIPIKSLSVAIEPVQDLHGQDAPYPAGGGKNKVALTEYGGQYNKAVGTDLKSSTTAAVSESGNSITVVSSGSWSGVLCATEMLPAGTYNAHVDVSASGARMSFYTTDMDLIVTSIEGNLSASGNITITLAESRRIAVALINSSEGTIVYTNVQVESGSSYTSWSPYSNICPISGHTSANVTRCGKNLFDGSIMADAMSGAIYTTLNLAPNTEYTMSTDDPCKNGGEVTDLFFCRMDESVSSIENGVKLGKTITRTSDAEGHLRVGYRCFENWITPAQLMAYNTQVEVGSTATAYEPYQGTTYPITFPSGTGTVYGGNIIAKQDGSWELVVDRKSVEIQTLDWYYDNSNALFTVDIPDIKSYSYTSNITKTICSSYKYKGSNKGWASMVFGEFGIANKNFRIKDTRYNTASAFKTALTGETILYELAEPISIPLTASQITTLLGQNSLWADCNGDVSVTYRADTALYIAKKIAEALNA